MMDLSLCPAPSSLTPNTVSMCPHRQMLSLPCGSQAVSCTGHQTSVTPCTDSSGRGQENTRFSSKAPSHLLGSSRSLCRAVGGAAGPSQLSPLCAQLSGGPGVSQDASAQHVTPGRSRGPICWNLEVLLQGDQRVLRNLGWFQSLEQLSCSTSRVCREPQHCWCQTPPSSSLHCRDVPPQPEDAPESKGLPGQEVTLMGRTLGHQGTGLEPPPRFTQGPEEPSASNDCPSHWKPGTKTLHSPWPALFPPPLFIACASP